MNAKRLLWINLSAPSIGDVLMDLSSRTLLKDFTVDVYLQSRASELFVEDAYFQKVFKTMQEAIISHQQAPYDLIIVDSFSPRILTVKNKIAARTPFVGIWGFLNGYEVHRTLYSFERMKKIMSIHSSVGKVALRPTIYLKEHQGWVISENKDVVRIGFAVGGEWASRRYEKWEPVISYLNSITCEVYLFGSHNGVETAGLIKAKMPGVHNFVGKLTLRETAEVISNMDVFVAADGGLWHIACALNKPSVSLFSGVFIFDKDGKRVFRDTADLGCEALYDEYAVSNIEADLVVSAIKKQLN